MTTLDTAPEAAASPADPTRASGARPVAPARPRRDPSAPRLHAERPSVVSTVLLLMGAVYCLFPVLWVVMASTKDGGELFSTFTLAPSGHLIDNVVALTQYRDGLFWRWMLNTCCSWACWCPA